MTVIQHHGGVEAMAKDYSGVDIVEGMSVLFYYEKLGSLRPAIVDRVGEGEIVLKVGQGLVLLTGHKYGAPGGPTEVRYPTVAAPAPPQRVYVRRRP